MPYDLLRPFSQVFNASMDCEGDEKSSTVKERVENARQIQGYRFKHGNHLNAFMGPTEVQRFCKISSASEALLNKAYKQQHLSARSLNQTLKVARTIADLDLKDEILEEHLMEALQYRRIEREERLWQM